MKRKKVLLNKLTEIIQIILDAKKLMNDSYRMLVTNSSEKFSLISRDPFLSRVRDSFWKLSVIELHKLYGSQNDNYNLVLLLENLIKNENSSEWESGLLISDLISLQNTLSNPEMQDRKEKLKELRNQHYAHKDQNPKNSIHNIKFYYIDFAYMLRAAELIVDELMIKCFGLSANFQLYDGQDAEVFLNTYLRARSK